MKITIAEPCHEKWDLMSPNDQVRHCKSCDKTVHNFAGFSDSEIVDFFRTHPMVCGRFEASQLSRDLSVKKARLSKWAIAACSALLLTSSPSLAQEGKAIGSEMEVSASPILKQVFSFDSVVRISVLQPENKVEHLIKVRLQIDDFQIDAVIDSSRSVSITLPSRIDSYNLSLVLYNQSGIKDTLLIDRMLVGNQFTLQNATVDGKWIMVYPWILAEPPTIIWPEIQTMGIPLIYGWGQIEMPKSIQPKISEVYILGDTVVPAVIDTFIAANEPVKKLSKARTKKSNSVWILLASAISALAFGIWVSWRKFKKKIKA